MELEGETATDGLTEGLTEPTDVGHRLTCLTRDLVRHVLCRTPASSVIMTMPRRAVQPRPLAALRDGVPDTSKDRRKRGLSSLTLQFQQRCPTGLTVEVCPGDALPVVDRALKLV